MVVQGIVFSFAPPPQKYWHDAFMRLRKYIIDRLNDYNPGLGTEYGELFPDFKMANEGQMIGEPIEALKLLVKAFPLGSYNGGASGESLLDSATAAAGRSSEGGPDNETKKAETQQVVTYVTVGLAVGLLVMAIITHLKKNSV